MSKATVDIVQQLEILPLSVDTKRTLVKLARRLRPHRDSLIEQWADSFLKSTVRTPALSDLEAFQLVERLVDLFLDHLEHERFDQYFADVAALIRDHGREGLSYNSLAMTIHLGEKTIVPILMRECRRRAELQSALMAMDHLYHNVLALLASNHFSGVCSGLERRNRELSALFAVAAAVSGSLDLDVILGDALDEVMKAMGLAAGEVSILNPETGRLELRAHRGLPSSFALQERSFSIGEGLPGLVVQRGEPVVVPDFAVDRRFPREIDEHDHLRYAIGIPLFARSRVVGAMDFFGTEILLLDKQDIKLLTSIGNQIGIAIENARLYQTVQARSSELEEARQRREEFISMVVHEFRGPLTVLTGYAQMLTKTLGKCEKCDARIPTTTLTQAKRLARLVDDLADTLQIENGRFEIHKAPVDLVALARDVVEQQQATSAEHKLVLEAPDEPIVGDWDPDRIAQVLVNLVGNAIKYSPPGEVRVVVARSQAEAEVSVIDHGPGIAEEDMPYLFQPFSRLYRKQEVKGTGLGLYIARGIIEAHGGRMWARSKLGAGSAFAFRLPLT